ncbi:GntR family transcriptional regulator [Thermovenabulum sp.]|uniref:GntR family transcriptional regulator n=1 Tax=Thermovenabulum sp. TaxID=3100335 RepID=UPI003C7AF292
MIDKKSPIPVYFQLMNYIKDEIKTKKLKPGDLLPSEREYCERFNISRMTVRQALKELEREGIIKRERGRGSFIASYPIEQEGIMSFTEIAQKEGLVATTRVLEFTREKAKNCAKFLNIDEQEDVIKATRLRIADGIPVALETVYLWEKKVPSINMDKLTGSLHRVLREDYGINITKSKLTFSAIFPTLELMKTLDMKETIPLLKIESVYYREEPVYYEVSFYRSDLFKVTVNLTKNLKGE